MIYLLRQCGLYAERAGISNASRSFVSTPACLLRKKVRSSTAPLHPGFGKKLLKDSDLTDIEEDLHELSLNQNLLTHKHKSKIGNKEKKLWKILTQKKMSGYKKGPNMLTSSEREHIRYLHQSNPEEWTPDELSKSFPALPFIIKKILKNKWTFESEEDIKKHDAFVLENWEKLKKNKLEAPPEVLNHLKKFINRRDTLKLQMANPQFFPELPAPPKLTSIKGPLNEVITSYEKAVEKIRKQKMEELKGMNDGAEDSEKNEEQVSLIEEVKMKEGSEGTALDNVCVRNAEKIRHQEEKANNLLTKIDGSEDLEKNEKHVSLIEEIKRKAGFEKTASNNICVREAVGKIRNQEEKANKLLTMKDGAEDSEKNKKHVSLMEEIKMKAESEGTASDNVFLGNCTHRRYNKEMTLQDLKWSILEKTKKNKKLSRFDEFVMMKTLEGNTLDREKLQVKVESPNKKDVTPESNKKDVNSESNKKNFEMSRSEGLLLDSILNKTKKEKPLKSSLSDRDKTNMNMGSENGEEIDPDLRIDDKTIHLNDKDLGKFLYRANDEDKIVEDNIPSVEVPEEVKEAKPTVYDLNPEKDSEMVQRDVDLLKGSSFWPSRDVKRPKSSDTPSLINYSNNSSPHMSPTMKTYFTYNYADRITIPEDKRKKGMTYRMKDCYYDSDGEFLFRVPGLGCEGSEEVK